MAARKPRPSKSEFVEIRNTKSKAEVAAHFGISLAGVHRLTKEFGIEGAKPRIVVVEANSFTCEEQDVVNGSLLGDGCLTKRYKPYHHSAFTELHGHKQLPYLEHKMERLARFNPYRLKDSVSVSPSTGNLGKSVAFKTQSNHLFTALDRKWYKHDEDGRYVLDDNGTRIKVVPADLALSPLSLAVWFCDDGCNAAKNRQATFSTQGFTWDEASFLRDELRRLGLVNVTIVKSKKEHQPLVLVGAKSLLDLFDMIRPHVPDCMKYKHDISSYTVPRTMVGEGCPATRLDDKTARRAFDLRGTGMTHAKIAMELGCSKSNISMILAGKTRKYLSLPCLSS